MNATTQNASATTVTTFLHDLGEGFALIAAALTGRLSRKADDTPLYTLSEDELYELGMTREQMIRKETAGKS